MFRLLGCICASASVMGLTLAKIHNKKQGCLLWLNLSKVCEAVIQNLRYKRAELFEVFKSVSKTNYAGDIAFLEEIIKLEQCFTKGNIQSVVEKHIADFDVCRDVIGFFCGLGKSDTEGQLRHCEAYKELFLKEYEAAKEKYNTDRRVCLSVGGYIAAAAFIMLI